MWRGATSPLNLTSLHYIMLTNAIAPTRSISFWFNVNIWRVQKHQGTALPFHPSKTNQVQAREFRMILQTNLPWQMPCSSWLVVQGPQAQTNLSNPKEIKQQHNEVADCSVSSVAFPGMRPSRDDQSHFIRVHRAFSCAPISYLV